jgi:hypothetical protein
VPDLGVRLQLYVGATLPLPAPSAVVDALLDLQVTNNDRERDGFQLRFSLGKSSPLDYGLLLSGAFDPPARVSVAVLFGALPQVLINGVVTSHQFVPSNRPGESTLVVTGEDVSLLLDLEEKNETFPNQPDSVVVLSVLGAYAGQGFVPVVTPTTDVPLILERLPNQQGTDLALVQRLARANGFVFYTEPTLPGVTTAYWGPENRLGQPQPALTMNMGSFTNVDGSINFSLNALGPATPTITIFEPFTGLALEVPAPNLTRPPLALRPVASLRKTRPRDTANLNPILAAQRALAAETETADAVTASGELDAARYGGVLRARRLVGVRGVGQSYDGVYYVKQVTHRMKRGEYKQSFQLSREGLGTLTPVVVP